MPSRALSHLNEFPHAPRVEGSANQCACASVAGGDPLNRGHVRDPAGWPGVQVSSPRRHLPERPHPRFAEPVRHCSLNGVACACEEPRGRRDKRGRRLPTVPSRTQRLRVRTGLRQRPSLRKIGRSCKDGAAHGAKGHLGARSRREGGRKRFAPCIEPRGALSASLLQHFAPRPAGRTRPGGGRGPRPAGPCVQCPNPRIGLFRTFPS